MGFRVWRICAVGLVGLLAGCKGKTAENGLIPITLQVDWYPQPEMGGFYEAQREGLYKAAGLDVKIAPGGPFVVAEQQVATGQAQFAMGSSDKMLTAVARGLGLVAVAATMQQDPQAVMVHEESPVRTFADLEGRTVEVKPGSTWFQYLQKRFGLKNTREVPATFSVANFLADPSYIQQVFVTSEPYFATKSGAKVRTMLVSSTGYQPYRVFFTSKAYLEAHPEVVKKFTDASLQGWRDYMKDPAKTDEEISRLNPAMSTGQMEFTVDALRTNHFVDGDGTPESHLGHFTDARWTAMYDQLVGLKVIDKTFDPKTAYTTSFAP